MSERVYKIMTVDDSAIMRRIVSNCVDRTLKGQSEFLLFEAEDGEKAWQRLEENPDMDVIFLDWNMPNMNGEELVIKMREDDRFKKTRIVMVTTEGGKDKVTGIAKKGVNGYIVKPFTPDKIETKLKELLARL